MDSDNIIALVSLFIQHIFISHLPIYMQLFTGRNEHHYLYDPH